MKPCILLAKIATSRQARGQKNVRGKEFLIDFKRLYADTWQK